MDLPAATFSSRGNSLSTSWLATEIAPPVK
jgi:hypothetical protein